MDINAVKSERLLQIYSTLVNGEILKKKELAQHFHVTERSIQRDIESLRCFLLNKVYCRMWCMIAGHGDIDWITLLCERWKTAKFWRCARSCWRAVPCGRMKCFPFWISCSPVVCRNETNRRCKLCWPMRNIIT